jgi:hypothetical protein
MLPWLTLIGRGSVFLGDELQAMTAAGQGTSAAAAAAAGVEATPAALVSPCQRFWQRLTPKVLALGGAAQKICEGSSAAHLARAGYNLQPLLEQLDSMTAALGQTVGASDTQPAGQLQALQVQLSAFGGLLTALAHPYACNNPDCANLSGASELRLVSGHSTKCSGCKTARYCCKACQVQHWQRHKPVCKAQALEPAEGCGVQETLYCGIITGTWCGMHAFLLKVVCSTRAVVWGSHGLCLLCVWGVI